MLCISGVRAFAWCRVARPYLEGSPSHCFRSGIRCTSIRYVGDLDRDTRAQARTYHTTSPVPVATGSVDDNSSRIGRRLRPCRSSAGYRHRTENKVLDGNLYTCTSRASRRRIRADHASSAETRRSSRYPHHILPSLPTLLAAGVQRSYNGKEETRNAEQLKERDST